MADETIMDRARRGEFDMYEVPEDGPEVASWCPSPTPTVPPTQVHLFLPMHGAVFVVRFKSPRTLDALIAALQSHREDVFGKPAPKVDDATKHAERHANGLCDADTCPVCAGAANDVAPSCTRDTSCVLGDGHEPPCAGATLDGKVEPLPPLLELTAADGFLGPRYRCAGRACPGLPWRASDSPHPASCVDANSLRQHAADCTRGVPHEVPAECSSGSPDETRGAP